MLTVDINANRLGYKVTYTSTLLLMRDVTTNFTLTCSIHQSKQASFMLFSMINTLASSF